MPIGKYKRTEEIKRKISEAMKGKQAGDKHPMYGKHHSIKTRKKMSETRCGENHPNWKGGKIKIVCKICGKEKYIFPYLIKQGNVRFCSRRCRSIWTIKHIRKHDTSIERLMEAELIKQNIPYLKQAPIEGIALVDFLLPNKTIIQCDGEYFHNLPGRKDKDANQDFILGFKGYKVFRFTGLEIKKSASKCIDKVIKNTNEAVINAK